MFIDRAAFQRSSQNAETMFIGRRPFNTQPGCRALYIQQNTWAPHLGRVCQRQDLVVYAGFDWQPMQTSRLVYVLGKVDRCGSGELSCVETPQGVAVISSCTA